MEYLNIESVTDGFEEKVHQNLKFKTGKFVWQIRFNTALDPSSVNNINLYVYCTSINSYLKVSWFYEKKITNSFNINNMCIYYIHFRRMY